jgi:hypothetical protein
MFSRKTLQELAPPPAALDDKDAKELFRAWIVKGGLQVSMTRGFDDPATWGLLLADIARHASRIYAAEGLYTEPQAMDRIRTIWAAEISSPTDLGATEPQG